jgi:predicted dithiol-disulfide oxidoreductase (DUF899 family)
MLGPGWKEGCKSCSYWADNFNGIDVHLRQRDVSFLAISRAPWSEIEAFEKRMGWTFKWVSSYGSDFNYDYYVSVRRTISERRRCLQLCTEQDNDGGAAGHQRDLQG